MTAAKFRSEAFTLRCGMVLSPLWGCVHERGVPSLANPQGLGIDAIVGDDNRRDSD